MIKNSLLRKFSTIHLTEAEEKVFAALMEASAALGKNTTLRAAGGWVRDKLLGGESSDIDIALDNIPGDEFAEFLYERERSKGNISSIGIVKENPEQSKHIRTASFRFYGLDFDVNNLRSETYTERSRIPEVKFAKHPSEDALRRDFTINALYFNLNTQEVEDFTGTGLSDLESGIVRTPLAAARTFVDDPLRVLRAIRFASRFKFELDGEIIDSWTHEDVRTGLMNKVSRERIGTEISKMMRDSNAKIAIKNLFKSGLMSLILQPPEQANVPSLAGVNAKDYAEWKKAWIGSENEEYDSDLLLSKLNLIGAEHLSASEMFYFNLCVLFLETVVGKITPNPSLVSRLAVKLSSNDSKSIGNILSTRNSFAGIFNAPREAVAVTLGRLSRGLLKEHLRTAFIVSHVCDSAINEGEITRQIDLLDSVISEFNLEKCHEWKPVIDGLEIQKLLAVKPGKRIQELLSIQLDMMFTGERDYETIKARLLSEKQKCIG